MKIHKNQKSMYKSLKDGANDAHTIKKHTSNLRIISLTLVVLLSSFFAMSGYSQSTKTIKGKVTDVSGASLPGVSVIVKGTTVGSITNLDGNYVLDIPINSKELTFSFIGMETQEIVLGNTNTINVTLTEKTVNVDEVVVIGYGSQKKSDLTGSITVVDVKSVVKIATNDITKALQGQVAGLSVQSGG